MNIRLALDGVCGNFAEAAIHAHINTGMGYVPVGYKPKKWRFYEDWGISGTSFGKVIDNSPYFWETIKPYDHLEELIEIINSYDPSWEILTTPRPSASCYAGKFKWVEEHLGRRAARTMTTTHNKADCYQSNFVLIDDRPSNYELWPGSCVLFPQPWNANRDVEDKMNYVKGQLELAEGTKWN